MWTFYRKPEGQIEREEQSETIYQKILNTYPMIVACQKRNIVAVTKLKLSESENIVGYFQVVNCSLWVIADKSVAYHKILSSESTVRIPLA